jgi:membrane protein
MGDPALGAALEQLGVDEGDARVVALLPLVQVAWADGDLDDVERETILRIASHQRLGRGGARALRQWLTTPPPAETYARGREVIDALAQRAPALEDSPPANTAPQPVHTGARLWRLITETVRESRADNIQRLGASLAYYTVFSMAPILVIAVAVAGLVFGTEAATGQVQTELQSLMGHEGAQAIGTAIARSDQPAAGTLATIIGFVTLLAGASGAFLELQTALNRVWGCEPPAEKSWVAFLRRRFVSFGLVLVIGFLLVVSTLATAAIAAFGTWAQGRLAFPPVAMEAANFGTSFVVITALFAMIYKVLPDVKVDWGDVWVGALFTSFLFAVGKMLIGVYLGHSTIASTFGAAGSLVVVLVWVYYSAQLLLVGAEFTQVWARVWGSKRFEPGGAMCKAGGLSAKQQSRRAHLEARART